MKILNRTTERKRTRRIGTLLVLLFSFSFMTVGQSLFTQRSVNDANLDASESQRYSNLQQDSFTQDLKLISFDNPLDFVNASGVIQFEVPGIQGAIEAGGIDITKTDTSYSWTGKLLNHAGYFGYYEIQGHRAAWLQIDGRFFEIMPMKTGISTLREIRGDVLDLGICTTLTENQANPESGLCQEEYNTCAATIDILVLLPPDATDWLQTKFGNDWFSIALYIGIGTQALNAAFINSDIPNKKANIILENFNLNYPPGTDCSRLIDSIQAQAAARREAVHADLVVLITAKRDFNCGSGAACAEISNNPPYYCDPGYAFSEIWWLFHPRWSMLHEVGHLMGGGHDRPYDNDDNCAHGWTVGGNRFQRTLMALWFGTQIPTDERILHYSNPDVVFNGAATGTASANNAKVIRNGACIVANYRQSQSFSAMIDTKPWVCRFEEYIYVKAIVQQPLPFNPGQPPYTYEWKWSYNGNFSGLNGFLFGNTQSASFPIPEDGNQVWVQLRVTSSDGLTVTNIKKITLYFDSNPKCVQRSLEKEFYPSYLAKNKISIAPNPTSSSANIRWVSENEGIVKIVITSTFGQVLNTKILQESKGENSVQIPVGSFPGGIYNISLQKEGIILTQKLIINL